MTKRVGHIFPELVAAHATMIGDAALADGDKWVQLLPLGRFSGRDGRGPYETTSAAHMQQVIDATRKRAGSAELVIDYDHQTIFSAVPGVGGNAPAAGWIKDFEVRDDGLWGRVEWTARATRAIQRGEYRYISPVYHHDKSGKITVLLNAGLTNVPNLDLAAVAASASLNPQEPDMKQIALALGLAEEADENAILAAITAVQSSASAIAIAAGLAATANPNEIVVAVQSAVAGKADPAKFVPVDQVTALQTEIKDLRTRLDGDAADVAVNKAIEDGKLVPALKDWALAYHKSDAAGFKKYVDGMPVLTAAQRASASAPNASADQDLTAEDMAVMSQLGLSKEAFLKSKKEGE